jgi:Kef-type K+ transport system membrane component KefB
LSDDEFRIDSGPSPSPASGGPRAVAWLAFRKDASAESRRRILAGVVLGNALIGRLPFAAHFIQSAKNQGNILDFIYWLGLLLLMFLAGAETQQLFTREERREVGWLTIVGTGLPFLLGLLLAPWMIRPSLAGPNGNRLSLTIILAVGVAVTSVPVVSKIFADLKILHTRFARLVLGVAVLEDIVLWLALAVATAMARKAALHPRAMSLHLLATVAFFVLGLTIVPRLIKRVNKARFNVLARHSPTGYPTPRHLFDRIASRIHAG